MSDWELRRLERKFKETSDFYTAGAWIRLAANMGLYDPADINNFVSFLTGFKPPKTSHDFGYGVVWWDLKDNAYRLLHNIRNAYGQWSAQQIKSWLDDVLSNFRIKYSVEIVKPDPPGSLTDEGIDLVPHIRIDQGAYIAYDEFKKDRLVTDFAPVYTLHVIKYFPGGRWEPPSEDIVEVINSPDIHKIIKKFLGLEADYAIAGLSDQYFAEEEADYWSQQIDLDD